MLDSVGTATVGASWPTLCHHGDPRRHLAHLVLDLGYRGERLANLGRLGDLRRPLA